MRVKGEGPSPAMVMAVGEGPGILESKSGRPFVGPAGQEFERYLNGYTLPLRDDIYITNLYKEWAGGAAVKKKEPTPEDLELSEWELFLELQVVQPKIVLSLGRWSSRWFVGDVDMESCHGLLYRIAYCAPCKSRWRTEAAQPWCNCGYTLAPPQVFYVMPIVHPAAGLHQPTMAAQTAYDFAQLAAVLKKPQSQWDPLCWKPAIPGNFYELGPGETFLPSYSYPDVGLDTEGYVHDPWGLSVSGEDAYGFVKRYTGSPITLPPNVQWVLHNYMHDKKVIESMGGRIPEDHFDDTMVMAYLLGIEPQALKALAYRHLGTVRPDFLDIFSEKLPQFGKPGKDKVNKKTGEVTPGKPGKLLKKTKTVVYPMDAIYNKSPEHRKIVINYAGADAADTRALKPILWKRIQALELEGIYEIDRRVLPLYARMEQVGIPVNMDYYAEFGKWLDEEIEIKTFLLQCEYPDFNPASPDQVAEIMFGHLKLPGAKKTPTGKRFTTNDKIMEALKDVHPFVAAMIEWRELAKCKNTFIDPLSKYVRGGRLFCQLLATRVVSGRLAAKAPNTLAFPKYTVLGQRFRGGVQAPPGRRLGSWDLNQIELRVLALDSGSPTLLHAFDTGEDLHSRTARKVFGLPPGAKEGKAERVAAKAVNFGIPMGLTEVGLAEQMRKHHYPFPELAGQTFKTQDDLRYAQAKVCQAWIVAVIEDWQLESYIKGKHAEARRFGYVRSRGGRIRFLPSVLSSDKRIREAAMRDAQAYGPQAGARFFMKQVEYRVWTEVILPLQVEGAYIEPILDVHDDLILEFEESLSGLLLPLIESIVASSFDEEIPITAKGAIGLKWSEI